MATVKLNVREVTICEDTETVTSDKRMCAQVEINYWLDMSCHKGSACVNLPK